jgi:hypothetical protein
VISEVIRFLYGNGQKAPTELAIFYSNFFDHLKPSKFGDLKVSIVKPLFKFCREIQANIQWLQEITEPYLLFDLASLKGSVE